MRMRRRRGSRGFLISDYLRLLVPLSSPGKPDSVLVTGYWLKRVAGYGLWGAGCRVHGAWGMGHGAWEKVFVNQ